MKYFIVNERHNPATLDDAKAVNREFVEWNVNARVRCVSGGYCIDTNETNIRVALPKGFTCVALKYEHVQGFVNRESANSIISEIKRWGGFVNMAAEAGSETYIDADILDDGFFNEDIKRFIK